MKVAHRILDPATVDATTRGLCALAIMTKAPRAGHVKTRLVPPLTHDEAAQLSGCFLRDTADEIARAFGATARGIGVYTPVGAETTYIDILPEHFELLAQHGDGFGERLTNAVEDLFRIGFASVCLIDSDSPTVSAAIYSKAVELMGMNGDRVVLGPSDDGGYYLIGLKQDHRRLFEKIDWSTERVLEDTKRRASELGLEIKLLPTCYDVDDVTALRRLCEELLANNPGSTTNAAPKTREFLARLIQQRHL